MQTKTLTLLFFLFIGRIFAQNDTTNTNFYTYKNQLGFGVSDLLFNNFNSSDKKNESYKLYYRRHLNKFNIRALFIYNNNYNFSKEDSPINKDYYFYTTSYNFKSGIDVNVPLNRSFIFNYGAELIYGYTKELTDIYDTSKIWVNTFDRKITHYGIGFLFRIEYRILKRLSISIESNMQFTINNSKNLFYSPSKQPSLTNNITNSPDFFYPKTLFLNFSF